MLLSDHVVDKFFHFLGRSVTRILFDFLGHAPSQKLYALSQVNIDTSASSVLPLKI